MSPRYFGLAMCAVMAVVIGSCTPNNSANIDADGCQQVSTLSFDAAGGSKTYGNWRFEADPAALKGATSLVISKCPTSAFKHTTLIGAQNKNTGAVELDTVQLEPSPEYGPLKIAIYPLANVANPQGLTGCPLSAQQYRIKSLHVARRIGGQEVFADPDPSTSPDNKCYRLVDAGQTENTVVLSAFSWDWDSVLTTLTNAKNKLVETVNDKIAIAMDPCAACTYVGTSISGQANLCAKISGGAVCDLVVAAAPIIAIPPIKQAFCSVANNAVNATIKAIAGPDARPKDFCELHVGNTKEIEDLITCDFHWGCHYVGLCSTTEGDANKVVKEVEATCDETCSHATLTTDCCQNDTSCFSPATTCNAGNQDDCERLGCDWDTVNNKCNPLTPVDLCMPLGVDDCASASDCTWNGTSCVKKP